MGDDPNSPSIRPTKARLYEFQGGRWATACPICEDVLGDWSKQKLQEQLIAHMNENHYERQAN